MAIEEYKHGPGRVVLHLPAGYLEPGEEPLAAAQRELREETGYEAGVWTSLGALYEDGNRGMSIGHHFLAQNARQVARPPLLATCPLSTRCSSPAELPRRHPRRPHGHHRGHHLPALMGLDALVADLRTT